MTAPNLPDSSDPIYQAMARFLIWKHRVETPCNRPGCNGVIVLDWSIISHFLVTGRVVMACPKCAKQRTWQISETTGR